MSEILPGQWTDFSCPVAFGKDMQGDARMSMLMSHGARAVVLQARHRDNRLNRWATANGRRSHPDVAALALASKTARMSWPMLQAGNDYGRDSIVRVIYARDSTNAYCQFASSQLPWSQIRFNDGRTIGRLKARTRKTAICARDTGSLGQ